MPDYNIQFWNPTKLYLFSFLRPATGRRKLAFMNINEKNSCRKYLKTTLVMELLLLVYFGSCTLSLSLQLSDIRKFYSNQLVLLLLNQMLLIFCCSCYFTVVVEVDVIHCKYMKTYVYKCICVDVHTYAQILTSIPNICNSISIHIRDDVIITATDAGC